MHASCHWSWLSYQEEETEVQHIDVTPHASPLSSPDKRLAPSKAQSSWSQSQAWLHIVLGNPQLNQPKRILQSTLQICFTKFSASRGYLKDREPSYQVSQNLEHSSPDLHLYI